MLLFHHGFMSIQFNYIQYIYFANCSLEIMHPLSKINDKLFVQVSYRNVKPFDIWDSKKSQDSHNHVTVSLTAVLYI